MNNRDRQPLTAGEFNEWAHASKGTLNDMDDKLGAMDKKLAAMDEKLGTLKQISTTLKEIRDELSAVTTLYKVLEHRDQAFGKKLKLDLKAIDAKFVLKKTQAQEQ